MSGIKGSVNDDSFSPEGLKVLVVDDDPMCLKVVSAMLKRCNYEVSTNSNGQDALAELRQRQEQGTQFDLVLSDVYMPDMDGFKLLESIGLELEVPVIMMSSDSDTNVVMRGVTHGAVDFLIKPVRIEELRNVWQHVVRRRSSHLSRAAEESGIEQDYDSQSSHGTKRKEVIRAEHEGGAGGKKPRVVWSVEMHQQFVYAVNTLGIDKAVPKRILDLMNVEGLTRENVASHLQKYRLYLKRVENVAGKGYAHAEKGKASDSKSGKPPLQHKGPRASRSSGTLSKIDMDDSDRRKNSMHTSGSTPNLAANPPWTPQQVQLNQPTGYYQFHGQMYPNHLMVGPNVAQPVAWPQNNMAGTMQYPGVGTSLFYQGSGNFYPCPTSGGPQHFEQNNVHSVNDGNQMHSVTDTPAIGSTNGAMFGTENDFDTVANNANMQSSSADCSPNKVDLVGALRSDSNMIHEEELPNIEGLQKSGKSDDHDVDVLNMFIEGMEGRP